MMELTVINQKNYKGFVIKNEMVDGKPFGCDDFIMTSAYTKSGDYVGDRKWAYRLARRGIAPEKSSPDHNVCSIGFCEREQKWYGWSHRAMCGFGIGDVAKEGDCCTQSGFVEEYSKEHPELDRTVPVGFEAKTLDDAKRMAIAFADSVS